MHPDQKTIEHTVLRAALCCTYSTAIKPVLCCTDPLATGQPQQHVVTQEPAGRSHSVLVITSPAWPCLYLTVQQDVLMKTSFLFDY